MGIIVTIVQDDNVDPVYAQSSQLLGYQLGPAMNRDLGACAHDGLQLTVRDAIEGCPLLRAGKVLRRLAVDLAEDGLAIFSRVAGIAILNGVQEAYQDREI